MANTSFKEQFIDTGLIKDISAWCFGKDPIVSPVQVAFAAGAKMFSMCAAFSFTCPKVKENNVFKFVFCAKLHSKIYRKDPTNRSSWYIWQPIGKSGCIVLDSDKFEEMTGVDIYKFVKTDFFKQAQRIFQKILKKGILASEDLRKDVPEEDHNEFNTYLKSLEEASQIVTEIPDIMEKTFKLINYDKFRRELEQQGYGDELKQRGATMTKHHQEIGKKFVDKVKRNELKAGEQDARAKADNKNNKK